MVVMRPPSRLDAPTDAAVASAARWDVCVFRRVLVTLRAVGLLLLPVASFGSLILVIIFVGAKKEALLEVDAERGVATVEDV